MSSIPDVYLNPNRLSSSSAIKGKSADDLSMDDFMTLLVAQMTNQDILNPTDSTEFVAQLAQFASLKGIQTIQEYQLSQYAASYIGKEVTIAYPNESTGELEIITGRVESVTYYNGQPKVIVNGTSYDLHMVMEINTEPGGSLSDVSRYIGKYASLSYLDEDGVNQFVSGLVTDVSLIDGKVYVTINGKAYPASGIKSVGDTPINSGPSDSDGSDDDGND